ncbi:VOC family protein [Ilumatobacter sp.]|uniref:VOC family protein n=1 Tax=Ilumatobacter sp. TaxID=1967498 RepID=UPI0037521625
MTQARYDPHPTCQRNSALHLDLRPDDQQSAVGRAIELGATLPALGQSGSESWQVLADPDGNPFCILQSQRDLDAGHSS